MSLSSPAGVRMELLPLQNKLTPRQHRVTLGIDKAGGPKQEYDIVAFLCTLTLAPWTSLLRNIS